MKTKKNRTVYTKAVYKAIQHFKIVCRQEELRALPGPTFNFFEKEIEEQEKVFGYKGIRIINTEPLKRY